MSSATRPVASPRVSMQHDSFFNWNSKPLQPSGIPFPSLCEWHSAPKGLRSWSSITLQLFADLGLLYVISDTTMLNGWVPLLFGLGYLGLTTFLSRRQNGKNRIQGKGWDAAVLAHNIFLAVYSMWP